VELSLINTINGREMKSTKVVQPLWAWSIHLVS